MVTNIKLPSDFAKKVAESLGITARGVDQLFDFSEDKQGFFVARLKPQQFLDRKDQFRTMCALVRDLGGEDYVEGSKVWKVPGLFAKKTNTTSTPETAGVAPRSVTDDKSKPPELKPLPEMSRPSDGRSKSGPYAVVPLKTLLSMPFQSRVTEDPELLELIESVKTYGVLEPILVRPKQDLFEVVAGERRLAAAKKAGLTEIPVVIKTLTDQEAFEVQFIENDQRKDYTDMERGRWLRDMLKRFPEAYSTQEALAKRLGKTQQWVSGLIRMVDLIDTDNITKRFVMLKPTASIQEVQALMHIEPEKRGEAVEQIKQQIEAGETLSVRKTKAIIEPEKVPERRTVEVLKVEPVDVAEFTCKICGEVYRISHVKLGVHELELMKR